MNDTIKGMVEALSIIVITLMGCAAWMFAVLQVVTFLKG